MSISGAYRPSLISFNREVSFVDERVRRWEWRAARAVIPKAGIAKRVDDKHDEAMGECGPHDVPYPSQDSS